MIKHDEIPPPRWPEGNSDLESALGRCIIAWGVLERTIGEAIEQVLRVDWDFAMSVTVNLAAGSKLQMFQALVHCHGPDLFGEHVVKDVDSVCARTNEAVGRYRNFLAHGQPWPVVLEEDAKEPDMWTWVWFSARKGGVGAKVMRLSAADIGQVETEIRKLVDDWHQLRLSLVRGCEILDFADSV